jgi:2-polyprenyl-3-methyl-5-hydroxy-6-metoxy-1,4-benzoquinol methylase
MNTEINQEPKIKILVAIASYGTGNDKYLRQLVDEYRSMSFDVDIVVLSNIQKEVGPEIELVVGLPFRNPWTLPYGHKKIFAERLNAYDLFIYSEDDILISEKNIRAFLKVSKVLPDNAIAGFLRFEKSVDGKITHPDVLGTYHWEPGSVQSIGEYQFAHFTNEHSACYVISREQLQRAIDSGGFLVGPHQRKYDLLCAAATDPYTQCGLRKLICISHLEEFLVHHVANKYIQTVYGVPSAEMGRQVQALRQIGENGHYRRTLFATETSLVGSLFSKDYYEPVKAEVTSAIPNGASSVLSLGCGWGKTEAWLAAKGMKVVAVPLDAVIPGGADAERIEIVEGDFETAREKLKGRQFDCLLVSNVLHLVDDPIKVLKMFAELLSPGALAIIVVPNLLRFKATYAIAKKVASYSHVRLPIICMKMFGQDWFKSVGDFKATGTRATSRKTLRKWTGAAGLRLEDTVEILPDRAKQASRVTMGLLDPVMADELIAFARRP